MTMQPDEMAEVAGNVSTAHSEGDGRGPLRLPIVINTWPFVAATQAAWETLNRRHAAKPALDAVEAGCATCEALQCDGTVGFGGSPDEAGETTLDAMIMDGSTMEAGAVSDLRFVKHAIATARLVMERTRHTMLAGLHATQFAREMGLHMDSLETEASAAAHAQWVNNSCQPNFRRRVVPDPARHCGPYRPAKAAAKPSIQQQQLSQQQQQQSAGGSGDSSEGGALSRSHQRGWPAETGHDTIAMAAISATGDIAVGCSTNGAGHKVPGRVGDGSVPGGGAYADSEVGACGATGDGDTHLRFLPCYQVVESMRQGLSPKQAAEDAVLHIARRVPGYTGALFALSRDGRWAGAAAGFGRFAVALRHGGSSSVQVVEVAPLQPPYGPPPGGA